MGIIGLHVVDTTVDIAFKLLVWPILVTGYFTRPWMGSPWRLALVLVAFLVDAGWLIMLGTAARHILSGSAL